MTTGEADGLRLDDGLGVGTGGAGGMLEGVGGAIFIGAPLAPGIAAAGMPWLEA